MNPYPRSLTPVWDQPTCVFVDRDKLNSFAARIAGEDFPVPDWREPVFPEDDDEVFVNFIGVGNAINFAFSDFDTHRVFTLTYQQERWQGAFALWAALSRALDEGVDFRRLHWLEKLTLSDAAFLFRGESPIPMLADRVEILRQTGTELTREFGGSFWTLVDRSGRYAFGQTGTVEVLINCFPGFQDESLHQKSGTVLKFHKRAQLFAMMYHGRAMSSTTLPRLKDYESLGPIADYSVPNALKALGILKYSYDLNDSILHGRLIAKDSVQEQEIRAQSVNAQIMLLEQINRVRRVKTNYLALDFKLWTRGRSEETRHHLTRTHAY